MRGTWTLVLGGVLVLSPALAWAQKSDDVELTAKRDLEDRIDSHLKLKWVDKKDVTFLGVGTSPVAPAMGRQLKLPDGMGLVIDFVEPGSPAAQAGLTQFDVLRKLDDQLLINPEQFAVLIRHFEKGHEIRLNLLHEGEAKSVTIKLGARAANAMDEVTPQYGYAELKALRSGDQPLDADALKRAGGEIRITRVGPQNNTVVWRDKENEYTLASAAARKAVYRVSRLQDGEVLFQDVIEGDGESNKIPQEYRKKLAELRSQLGEFGDSPEFKSKSEPDYGDQKKFPVLGEIPGIAPLFNKPESLDARRRIQIVDENGRVVAQTDVTSDRGDQFFSSLSEKALEGDKETKVETTRRLRLVDGSGRVVATTNVHTDKRPDEIMQELQLRLKLDEDKTSTTHSR